MSNMQALGYLMDYCNRNLGQPEITQANFNRWQREILNSPEGRFAHCSDAQAIIRELSN